MNEIEIALVALAPLFLALAGFAGIMDAFQRNSVKIDDKVIGLRLSLRFGLYGMLLSLAPILFRLISHNPNLSWDISMFACILVFFRELIKNLVPLVDNNMSNDLSTHIKRFKLAELIAKLKTSKFGKPPSPALLIIGVVGTIGTLVMLLCTVFYDIPKQNVYLLALFWLLVLSCMQFITYSHKDWPDTLKTIRKL